MNDDACRYDGQPLPSAPKTGRPPTYCSAACRRAAEYEIRRLSRRLERLEDQSDLLARLSAMADDVEYPRVIARRAAETAVVADQIASARLRLRDLLEDRTDAA